MARDYGKSKHERESVVTALYALGITAAEIAQAIGWNRSVVLSDINRITATQAFPERPHGSHAVFAAVLHRYASIVHAQGKDAWRSPDAEGAQVRDALAVWLREEELLALLRGMMYTMNHACVPAFDPKWNRHAELLSTMLILPLVFQDISDKRLIVLILHWWYQALETIATNDLPVPQSREVLSQTLVNVVHDVEFRQDIMPIWDDAVFKIVEALIDKLGQPEQQVIRMRYGLSTEGSMSLSEVAAQLRRPSEAVCVLHANALQKLRGMMHQCGLEILQQPVGDALQRELKRRAGGGAQASHAG